MRSFLGIIAWASILSANSRVYAVLVLPDLPAGTQYRLAFVTSTTRDATSSNIADYNAFVTTAANTQSSLVALGTTWTAIASTATVSARTNTNTDPTPAGDNGVPIYRLDGVKIADHYDDLWDGDIDATLSVDEAGSAVGISNALTGSNSAGDG